MFDKYYKIKKVECYDKFNKQTLWAEFRDAKYCVFLVTSCYAYINLFSDDVNKSLCT